MGDTALRHRLLAILAADAVGYSRLMGINELNALAALDAARQVFKQHIDRHLGRLVDTAGDSVLAVFDTAAGAVKAALGIQQQLAGSSHGAPEQIRLRFRIGVHLGDVIEKADGSVYGNGVNVAARLQSLAAPDGTLVSDAVRSTVGERCGYRFDSQGEHRIKNIAEPVHIYRLSYAGTPEGNAQASRRPTVLDVASLATMPNNLPQQASSFVGRERELAEIGKVLLATRVLTLAGVGGLGKTRLALQVAAQVAEEFPDGVWFSDLAAVADARLVPQAVALVLGVQQRAGEDAAEALLQHVRGRKLLIVLDNCEHLLQACADLARLLLQSGDSVKILATSRESLRIGGETTYLVPSLAIPDGAEVDTAATAARYGAVRLFVERAAAAQSAFELTDRLAPAVVEICRQLDGIPLAIELAAARVRSLPVPDIAQRLTERLRLLTGGDRAAPARHKTLRASIDWSHELLADDERTLLRRLSVFVGGWTLEAAEHVCADGSIDREMVLELLTALVEKSLVQFDSEAGRYRMLETVREYARERLDESAKDDRVHTHYVRFYVELAERAKSELRGPAQAEWFAKLDRERENLVGAHARSGRAEGGTELDLRLVDPFTRYCVIRGVPQLGHRIAVEALARGGAEKRNRAHCDALFAGGQIAAHLGRYDEARSYLDRSLAMAREIGETNRSVASLTLLGTVFLGEGDFAAAQGSLEQAVAAARATNNERQVATGLSMLAEVHHTKRELEAAERLYREALEYFRSQGDADSIAVTLCNLAMVWIDRGLADRAQAATLEALDIVEAIGSRHAGHTVLEVMTGLAAHRASWEDAALFCGAAARLAKESGLEPSPPDVAFLGLMIQRAHAAIGVPAFAAAEQAGGTLDYAQAIARAREWLTSSNEVRVSDS